MSQDGVPVVQPPQVEVPQPEADAVPVAVQPTEAVPEPPVLTEEDKAAAAVQPVDDEEPPAKRARHENGDSPANGQAEGVAVEAAEAVADDAALLDALDGEEDAVPAPPAPEPVVEVDPLAGAAWEDLFGTIPLHEVFPPGHDDEAPAEDPEQHDVRQALLDCFGSNFSENTVSLYQATDVLREAVQTARLEQSNDDVDACFGVSCRVNLLSKPGAKFVPLVIKTAKRPKNPLRGSTTADGKRVVVDGTPHAGDEIPQARILLEMPTIMPNRQILHADPSKYKPKEAKLIESTPRAVHTPQNTMRWNYIPKNDVYLSNARYVKWSDNSTTLHVGSDVYETFDNVDSSLHMIARTPASADQQANDALNVEAIPIDRHMMVRAAAGVPNSIESYIQHVSNVERSIELQSRVDAPLNALPDFDVAKDKRPPRKTEMSLEESFVKSRRALYAKEFAKRHGARPTLTDYFKAEMETLRELEEVRRENTLQATVTRLDNEIAASKTGRFGKPLTRRDDDYYPQAEEAGNGGEGAVAGGDAMEDFEGEDFRQLVAGAEGAGKEEEAPAPAEAVEAS